MIKKKNFNEIWIEQLLNSSHVGILVVDNERNNLFVNAHLCELMGYSEEEFLASNARIFHLSQESYLEFGKKAFAFALEGKPVELDYQFRKKDGTIFWIHISGDLISSKKEVLWSVVDISQRKTLELESYKKAQIVDQMQDGIVTIDLAGNATSWNSGAQRILGYAPKDVIGKSTEMLYLDVDYETRQKNIQSLLRKGVFRTERRFVAKDQSIKECDLTGSLLRDNDGAVLGMIGYFKDISERKKEQKSLKETNYNLQQYMDVIDKIDIGIFVVDDDFRVRFMNNTMKKWFGDQTNKTCYSSVVNLDEPCPYCKLHEVIHENEKVVYEPITPDGQSFDIVATSIKNPDGTISKMEVIRNVTEKKNAEKSLLEQKEELRYQAHHDALTGLANRVLFNDRLEQGIKKAKRLENKLALLFIDLDHFKEINDSLGHQIGDEVLKETTQRLHSIIREEDSLARLGGDEFTIIIENIQKSQDASSFANKILKVLAKPLSIEGHTLYVSSSIGISIYPDDGESLHDLLKFADSAMYKAKDEGRNNFQFYSAEMTELAFERIVMETSLRQAIQNNEFLVYYQPQVDALEDKIIGMEALVRWNHPVMGILSPAKFIPLAESTGMIVDLDRLVMKEALRQFSSWKRAGFNPGVLAMNLAVPQLQSKDFVEIFEKLVQNVSCDYEDIELEVTESQIMKRQKEAIEVLNKLGTLGVSIAIDDFGTGYSSLSYLKKLPINKLKIDQSFVKDLPNSEEDVSISKAIIALAKSLNLRILAEGVELSEQKEFLLKNGCNIIQGYYYSKPVPSKEMEILLKNGFNKKDKQKV